MLWGCLMLNKDQCKDCKFWGETDLKFSYLGIKTMGSKRTGLRQCWNKALWTQNKGLWNDDVKTGPEFGCVHFQGRGWGSGFFLFRHYRKVELYWHSLIYRESSPCPNPTIALPGISSLKQPSLASWLSGSSTSLAQICSTGWFREPCLSFPCNSSISLPHT